MILTGIIGEEWVSMVIYTGPSGLGTVCEASLTCSLTKLNSIGLALA